MAVWRGHEYYERTPASPVEGWAQDATRVVRTLDFPHVAAMDDPVGRPDGVPLTERQRIARDFLGYATVKTLGTRRWIERLSPHFYPSGDPLLPATLYATGVPSGEMLGAGDFDDAVPGAATGDTNPLHLLWRAQVVYGTPPYDVKEDANVLAVDGPLKANGLLLALPDEGDALRRGWALTRHVIKSVKHSGRVIPIIQGNLWFEDVKDGVGNPIPTREPFPLNEQISYVTYTWMGVPLEAEPKNALITLQNCVNTDDFDGWPVGTLLFLSHDTMPRRDSFGQRTIDIQYRFMACMRYSKKKGVPLGHNAMPLVRDDGLDYYFATSARDGATVDFELRPYRYVDMGALFRPDQP